MMMTTMKASGTGTSPRTSDRLKSYTISSCQPSLNQFMMILVWRKGIMMKCYKTYMYIYTYLFHIAFDCESVHCQSQVNFHVDFFEGFIWTTCMLEHVQFIFLFCEKDVIIGSILFSIILLCLNVEVLFIDFIKKTFNFLLVLFFRIPTSGSIAWHGLTTGYTSGYMDVSYVYLSPCVSARYLPSHYCLGSCMRLIQSIKKSIVISHCC